jgi:hypothetical protein
VPSLVIRNERLGITLRSPKAPFCDGHHIAG